MKKPQGYILAVSFLFACSFFFLSAALQKMSNEAAEEKDAYIAKNRENDTDKVAEATKTAQPYNNSDTHQNYFSLREKNRKFLLQIYDQCDKRCQRVAEHT